MKSFNNNGANLNSSLGHLDRTGFAGNTASRRATVEQQGESTWSGRNARTLSGTQSSQSADVFVRTPTPPPAPAPAPSPLASGLALAVKDTLGGTVISLPSLAGLRAMLGKAGLKANSDLSDPGVAAPLRALGERYPEGDVRRALLERVASGDQAALAELMKKRAS